jgi:hypothetical protein
MGRRLSGNREWATKIPECEWPPPEHPKKAPEHLEHAKAAHHAHVAHAQHLHSHHHADEAAKSHLEEHGKP